MDCAPSVSSINRIVRNQAGNFHSPNTNATRFEKLFKLNTQIAAAIQNNQNGALKSAINGQFVSNGLKKDFYNDEFSNINDISGATNSYSWTTFGTRGSGEDYFSLKNIDGITTSGI